MDIAPSPSDDGVVVTTLGLVVRHLLTTGAGALVADGIIKDSDTTAIVGAGMVAATVAWSWWQKRGQALAIEELKSVVGMLTRQNASLVTTTAAAKVETADAKAETALALSAQTAPSKAKTK